MNEYSQGIMNDGAVILKNGEPMTPEEIVVELTKMDETKLDGGVFVNKDFLDKIAVQLKESVQSIEDWASYASVYFQKKHDLEGEIERNNKAINDILRYI